MIKINLSVYNRSDVNDIIGRPQNEIFSQAITMFSEKIFKEFPNCYEYYDIEKNDWGVSFKIRVKQSHIESLPLTFSVLASMATFYFKIYLNICNKNFLHSDKIKGRLDDYCKCEYLMDKGVFFQYDMDFALN